MRARVTLGDTLLWGTAQERNSIEKWKNHTVNLTFFCLGMFVRGFYTHNACDRAV